MTHSLTARLREMMGRAPEFPDKPLPVDDGYFECPMCNGEGSVSAEEVSDATSSQWPGGVQFYGVGHEHQWCEEFYLEARKHMPALLAVVSAAEQVNGLRDAVARSSEDPISKEHWQGKLRKWECILREALAAVGGGGEEQKRP